MWELSVKAFNVAIINSQEVKANILEIEGKIKRKEIKVTENNQMERIKLKNKITTKKSN